MNIKLHAKRGLIDAFVEKNPNPAAILLKVPYKQVQGRKASAGAERKEQGREGKRKKFPESTATTQNGPYKQAQGRKASAGAERKEQGRRKQIKKISRIHCHRPKNPVSTGEETKGGKQNLRDANSKHDRPT